MVSTCGTAVGAKQGRTKGNEQKAEYIEPERMARETRPEARGRNLESVSGTGAPE